MNSRSLSPSPPYPSRPTLSPRPSRRVSSSPAYTHLLPEIQFLLYQDHGVFARHSKFGTFQVPKEFLNTNKKAPAAVAPKKAVQQARRAYMCSPCGAISIARLALPDFSKCNPIR